MKKIKQLPFVLFIFSVLAFSYPVTQVFAQEGAHVSGNHISGGQCDPGPACNPNDPNAIPCCGFEGNNMPRGSSPSRMPPPLSYNPGMKQNDPLIQKLMVKIDQISRLVEAHQEILQSLQSTQQATQKNQATQRQEADQYLTLNDLLGGRSRDDLQDLSIFLNKSLGAFSRMGEWYSTKHTEIP